MMKYILLLMVVCFSVHVYSQERYGVLMDEANKGGLVTGKYKEALDYHNEALKTSDIYSAINLYNKAISLYKNKIFYYNRATLFFWTGEYTKSIDDISRLVNSEYFDKDLAAIAGYIKLEQGAYQEAVKLLSLAERKGLNEYELYIDLAHAYMALEDYRLAYDYASLAESKRHTKEISELRNEIEVKKNEKQRRSNELVNAKFKNRTKFHISQTKEVDGIVFLNDPTVEWKISGEIFKKDRNGQLMFSYMYDEGKRQGKSLEYYGNGRLKSKETYLSGKLHGVQEKYFEDGSKEREAQYKHGKLVGVNITYDQNGDIVEYVNYSEDGLETVVERKIYEKSSMLNSNYLKIHWTLKGSERIIEEYNDMELIISRVLEDLRGKKQLETIYEYHSNREVKAKSTYSYGCSRGMKKLHGKQVAYYANGDKEVERTFDCGDMIDEIYY